MIDASSEQQSDRILIIEDDQLSAGMLVRALDTSGFVVSLATSGVQGLELAQMSSFGVVLLGLFLSDLDGISLLAQLISVKPESMVIVLAAQPSLEVKVQCFDLGASHFLEKPFALDEVVARVRACLRVARVAARGRYPGNDRPVQLDLRRRVAVLDGKPIALSPREFLLLEYLIRRRGEVASRKELLEYVWGYAFDPGTNVVDVYVRRLRTKIGNRRIETIRRVGYRLDDTPRHDDADPTWDRRLSESNRAWGARADLESHQRCSVLVPPPASDS